MYRIGPPALPSLTSRPLTRLTANAVLYLTVAAIAMAVCAACGSSGRPSPPKNAEDAPPVHPKVVYKDFEPGKSPESTISPEARRFLIALITIYQHVRAAEGIAPPAPEEPTLLQSARTLQELKPKFGEYWRRIAVAKLGASGINRPDFQAAIQAMEIDWHALNNLIRQQVLSLHRELIISEKLSILYDYIRKAEAQYDPQGVPNCDHQVPVTSAGPPPNAWSVTATTSVFLGITASQLGVVADPQNWDNECGKPFFNETYITDPTNGVFPVNSCVAAPGSAKPTNTEWHGYVWENFNMPPSGDYYDNILYVDSVPTTGQYSLTYELEAALCTRIAPDPVVMNGLFDDSGTLLGIDAGYNWAYVHATKTIGFNDVYTSHTPAQLAAIAGPALEALGDALPYWLCCPK